MMEHDDTPWEFGESWYYFKKRSDKVNLLIRCLMSPCFKIIQVAVCGPWCPLPWPQPLRICYPSKSTLNLERWLWNALDHHFQIAEVHFFGFTCKACKVFLGVLKHLGTLSLSHDSIHAQKITPSTPSLLESHVQHLGTFLFWIMSLYSLV